MRHRQRNVYFTLFMNTLPASIESSLHEAGFTDTEVVIMRKLLQEDDLTLRELASKTGKSTGVLDQAMKKLLRKRIIERHDINGNPKYTLQSMQSVLDWIRDDAEIKQQMMVRKYRNFEIFLETIKKKKERPEMHFFDGKEGMERAYEAMLSRGRVFLCYGPPPLPDAADHIDKFQTHYIRERKKRDIFMRIITHDTPGGRSMQLRDEAEFRQTVLVDPREYPFFFEMYIVGDTVACFQTQQERACFIRFPEMAEDERAFFEQLWKRHTVHTQKEPEKKIELPMLPRRTRNTLPMKEIVKAFAKKRSVQVLGGVLCLLLALIPILYSYTFNVTKAEAGERLMAIVSTAAKQVHAEDLAVLHWARDMRRPEYQRVFKTLNDIRNSNQNIKYLFIYRPTDTEGIWEFVADADSNYNTPFESDLNHNGLIEPDEQLMVYPGERYDMTTSSKMILKEGMLRPTYEKTLGTDQWVTDISGGAPIKDVNGKSVAVLAADISLQDLSDLTTVHFKPILFSLIVLIIAVFVLAFIQCVSVFEEYAGLKNLRRLFVAVILLLITSGATTFGLYRYNLRLNIQRVQDRVLSIAATGALQFDVNDLEQIHTKDDIHKPEYAKVIGQLNEIRNQNDWVVYAYLLRPKDSNTSYFIADADSLNPSVKKDTNFDGKIDKKDTYVFPGDISNDTGSVPPITEAYEKPTAFETFHDPQWGDLISSYAPIKDASKKTVALFGVDVFSNRAVDMTNQIFSPWVVFPVSLLIFACLYLLAFERQLLRTLWARKGARRFTTFLVVGAAVSGVLTYGLYAYTQHLNLQRIEDKVLSIASTGALQFDLADLKELNSHADMQKPQYKKVVNLLGLIREKNHGVVYSYLMRPGPGIHQAYFVADADGLELPVTRDMNHDGKVDAMDSPDLPGDLWTDPGPPPYVDESFKKPTIYPPYKDARWGYLISACAPIKDKQGKTVAIYGADIFASDVSSLTNKNFVSLYSFLGFFFIFFCLYIVFFERALLQKLWSMRRLRRCIAVLLTSAAVSGAATYSLYLYTQHLSLQRMQQIVKSVAEAAAPQFDPNDINALQVKDDWQKPEWARVGNRLKQIKDNNKDLMYVYVFRKTKQDPTKLEFVGDADSINPFANTDNDPTNDIDMNGDGKIDGSPTGGDYQAWPGQPYPTAPTEAFDAYKGSTANRNFYQDQWGRMISGYAPIKDSTGTVVAIVAADMKASKLHDITQSSFAPVTVFLVLLILLIVLQLKLLIR